MSEHGTISLLGPVEVSYRDSAWPGVREFTCRSLTQKQYEVDRRIASKYGLRTLQWAAHSVTARPTKKEALASLRTVTGRRLPTKDHTSIVATIRTLSARVHRLKECRAHNRVAVPVPMLERWPILRVSERGIQVIEEAKVRSLPDSAVLALAPQMLHAANRAAKHNRRSFQTHRTYEAKNHFLEAAVLAGKAERVERFERRTQNGWSCCDREWFGPSGLCYCCRQSAAPMYEDSVWFIVQVEGYRFHQPASRAERSEIFEAVAVDVEAHDPTQKSREIPNVGFAVHGQLAIVKRAAKIFQSSAASTISATAPANDVEAAHA